VFRVPRWVDGTAKRAQRNSRTEFCACSCQRGGGEHAEAGRADEADQMYSICMTKKLAFVAIVLFVSRALDLTVLPTASAGGEDRRPAC
jgi:hypothetical protein